MAYPQSADVSAGDATLAAHYNNLRKDAVFLGEVAANAVALGTLLERYESRLNLERLSTDKIKVVASAAAPVSLVVDGYLVQAVADVDLAAGEVPAGAAAAYYVFANRVDASTTFTLTVSTSATETANQRLIGRFYWDGTKIIKDSVRSDLAGHIADLLYLVDPQVCHGRLTVSTGVPVPTSDIASSASVFFTPYIGDRVALYVQDYGWRIYQFGELSLDVSAVAADTNYDIFIYDNAGTLTLSYLAWSNDTLRATAIARQDGVLTKSGFPEYRYIGTFRSSGAGVTCDTLLKRFIWNYYNRIEREMLVTEDTDSWTYATANVWRSLNNSDANRVQFVIGVNESLIHFEAHVQAQNSGNNDIGIGLGLDATAANSANIMRGSYLTNAGYTDRWYGAIYKSLPGIGFHYLQIIELSGGGTTTLYGDRGNPKPVILSGGIGHITM